ncbi:MAG: hypothetical protein CML02_02440 [Pseudooceanicola sp.]|nr:hypothetical protein [Pseudooceanicola sp.]
MAYSQSDLDQLQRMIAKGIKRGRLNGEEVEFRDLNQMWALEKRIKRELGQIESRRVVNPSTSSGWR